MIRGIIGASLQFRFLVLGAAAALIVMGGLRLRTLPVDVLPEFGGPVVEIQTEALGLSAVEVENLVTLNLEDLLNGVPWVRSMQSESVTGLSSIRLMFEPGTDIRRARQLVQERLTNLHGVPNVSKPPTITPVVLQPVSATARVMMVGLSSQTVSPVQMSVVAQWTVKPKLLGVAGVANVAIWGERRRQLQVQVDPHRMQAHGVTQERVVTSTGDSLWVSFLSYLKASVPGTGGWIDTPSQRLEVRHVLPMSSPTDLARVSVDGSPGLRLGDVAKVVEQHPPVIGDALVGDGSGLLLVIEKFPWADTLSVTRGVEKALDALRPGLPGVNVNHEIFRPATFVEMSLGRLNTALLMGAGLLVLALAALVARWRVAVIVLVSLTSALAAAVVVLHMRGAALNIMVLAGFLAALAVLIDDVVADVDNIVRHWRQRRSEESGASAIGVVAEAAQETRGALLYATLILMLAVVPVLCMGGLLGAFFAPLALSYVLALAAGLAAGVTVTPALATVLLNDRAAAHGSSSALMRGLEYGFQGILRRAVHAPQAVVGASVAVALLGAALWPLLGEQLLPKFKEGTLQINWAAKPGTSHPEMFRITQQAARELRAVPGVTAVNAHVGRAETGDQIVGMHSGQLWVNLDPAADYDRTVSAVQNVVNGYTGIDYSVGTYLQGRIGEALTGSPKPVVVRVYGPDWDTLRRLGDEVRQALALARINGLVDLQAQGYVERPEVQIKVDLAAAGRAGLKPGDVRRAASTMLSGLEVGKIFEAQKVFDVMVWSTPESRRSVTDIQDLPLETPGGGHVRLGDVAEVRVKPAPAVIRHVAMSPYVDITGDVSGRDVGAVVREVERRMATAQLPFEYYSEILGGYSERQANLRRVLLIAAVVGLAILLLLQTAVESWRLALAMMLVLPAALAGGVLAMFAGSGVVSLGGLIGLLAVLGLALRNGLVLMRHYRRLERSGGIAFGPELALRGVRDRFAPIMTTAIAAGLAVLPLALPGNSSPGLEVAQPMAVVMLGGLLTATAFSLFVVPALYLGLSERRPPGAD